MAAFKFNPQGAGGLPVLVPEERFSGSTALSKVGKATPRVQDYGIPGLSGEGSNYFGVAPVPITTRLTLMAANRSAFAEWERDVRKYLRGGRYVLFTENGGVYPYTELRGYEPGEMRSPNGTRWVLDVTLEFLWMQPE